MFCIQAMHENAFDIAVIVFVCFIEFWVRPTAKRIILMKYTTKSIKI